MTEKEQCVDLSKLNPQERAMLERELAWRQILLGAAFRMTQQYLQTPILKKNRRNKKRW